MNPELNGSTAVYGILGRPVAHSLSPLIHNTLAKELGMNLVYVPLGVEDSGRITDAVRGAYAMGIRGMNVTVPYKSAVIPCLQSVDPVAEAIGAVNTLTFLPDPGENADEEDSAVVPYKGWNTDYLGLRRTLDEMLGTDLRRDLKSMDVVLIGAGGAARAAGFMAAEAGVRHLTILNRTLSKAETLVRDIGRMFPDVSIRALPLSMAASSLMDDWNTSPVLAIQCTNVGLAPGTDKIPVEDPYFYDNIEAGFDCIYNPEETR